MAYQRMRWPLAKRFAENDERFVITISPVVQGRELNRRSRIVAQGPRSLDLVDCCADKMRVAGPHFGNGPLGLPGSDSAGL